MKQLDQNVGRRDFRVVCAWCRAHLRGRSEAELVSHGICPSCREALSAKLARTAADGLGDAGTLRVPAGALSHR